jgi:hypothetical protein
MTQESSPDSNIPLEMLPTAELQDLVDSEICVCSTITLSAHPKRMDQLKEKLAETGMVQMLMAEEGNPTFSSIQGWLTLVLKIQEAMVLRCFSCEVNQETKRQSRSSPLSSTSLTRNSITPN